MADFAPLKSAEYTALTATPRQLAAPARWGAKTRASSASLTFTDAGTGTATMLRLPAGKVRILPDRCRIVCPQGTADADLHVGYAAHVHGTTGLAVIADDNAFANDVDVGAGDIDAAFTLPAVGYLDLDSADGVDVTFMIDTADSPAAGEAWLLVVFTQGN